MILSTNQPYFAPFPGFFLKAGLSDVLVILDEVQFPRGTTWITRNRFKNAQGTLWITLPVWKKGLGLQRIDQVRLCREGRWEKKHLASLKAAYARAPYLEEHLPFLEEVFSLPYEKIVELNLSIIRYLMKCLEIPAEVLRLSDLKIDGTGNQRLVEICMKMGAGRYLAQEAAKKYLDLELFEKAGIETTFIHTRSHVYPQLHGDFIGNLSTLDLLFNCGPKAREIIMKG